jgi:GT2 family glycosyltransferase
MSGGERPFFSIIVPTYNRPEQLAVCLRSLAKLDYPRDRFEVIVVDDGSQTRPEAVVAAVRDRLDVSLVSQSNAGPAAARNAGAKRARGTFLAFTDDDCRPAASWLTLLADRFAATPDHLIGGRTINALPGNRYSMASQALLDFVYRYEKANFGHAHFFASANLAVPADQFRAIGGFNPDFRISEDRELCDRWVRHGFAMTYAPEIIVYHAHALTLRSFFRQHFDYGRGAFRFHRTRSLRGSGRLQPDKKFYLGLLRYSFTCAPAQQTWLLAGLLVVSQVANASGFFREWTRHKLRKVFGSL